MMTPFQPELFRPNLPLAIEPYTKHLDRSVERFPDKLAVVYRGQTLTYRELNGLINSFAQALLSLGVTKGDRVCLYMTNRPEYLISFFACARLGAVATPMNPVYKEMEASHQLNDSEAKVLVAGEAQYPVVLAIRPQLVNLESVVVLPFGDLIRAFPPDPPPQVVIDPDEDLLALPYSSGTTGLPKGVMLTHRNVHSNNLQFISALRMDSSSVSLVYLPFYHIYGSSLMGGTVTAGATQVIMERFEPVECLENIQRYRVTHWFAVPPILLALSNYPDIDKYDFSSVRFVMTGAAPLPTEVGRRFTQATGVPVIQGYGLTEASPMTHLETVDMPEIQRLDSIGYPISNMKQKIVDLDIASRVLAPGEIGELCVRGPQVMKGYWKAPEATAEALRDGWLHTGDIGYIAADGHVFITDRKKEMIKYKGFGVAPAEVEAALHEHPAVADAAVIGKPDPDCGEIPKAYVVLRKDVRATAEEIMAFVAGRVAGYKQVREVEFTDAIPRNPSGKILRRVLKERERERQQAG